MPPPTSCERTYKCSRSLYVFLGIQKKRLHSKFAARLFDDAKYRDPATAPAMFYRRAEHRALARSAAQEGAVLLKNAAPAPRGAASNCSDGHFLAGMDWGGVSTCYHGCT